MVKQQETVTVIAVWIVDILVEGLLVYIQYNMGYVIPLGIRANIHRAVVVSHFSIHVMGRFALLRKTLKAIQLSHSPKAQ